MKICNKCASRRILTVSVKYSDHCGLEYLGRAIDGYIPDGLRIGGGDYIQFHLCLHCGRIQGKFPVDASKADEAFGIKQEA